MNDDAHAFLVQAFANKPEGCRIGIWQRGSRMSLHQTPDSAALQATKLNTDVYVATTLLGPKITGNGRNRADDAQGIVGLWLDIDVNGGPENKKHAAPDQQAAVELSEAVLQPTLKVWSGYGLHAWWLLEAPWVFQDDADREHAAQTVRGFRNRMMMEAKRLGFTLDAVQDFARVLRVPGTLNTKGGRQAPVTLLDDGGPRYEAKQLRAYAVSSAAVGSVDTTLPDAVVLAAGRKPPMEKFAALLANHETFASTWGWQRPEFNSDPSSYDMALAGIAVTAGWDDQEIADLIVYFRETRQNNPDKALRRDYIARTIGRARQGREQTLEAERQKEALEELVSLADQPVGGDHGHRLALFSSAFGGPPIKEFIQYGLEADKAKFMLVLADGTEVPLGGIERVWSQERFGQGFVTVTGYSINAVKRSEWERVRRALFAAREVREHDDWTARGVVREWLDEYLTDREGSDDLDEAIEHKRPFIADGDVYVFGREFWKYVTATGERLSLGDFRDQLRRAGFMGRTVPYTRRGGERSSRYYFYAPRDSILGGE